MGPVASGPGSPKPVQIIEELFSGAAGAVAPSPSGSQIILRNPPKKQRHADGNLNMRLPQLVSYTPPQRAALVPIINP